MQQKEIEEADNNIFGILIKNFVTGADGSEFLRILKTARIFGQDY